MGFLNFQLKITDQIKEWRFWLTIFLVLLVLISLSVWLLLNMKQKTEIQVYNPEQGSVSEEEKERGKLFVDISGGVNQPGVYELNEGDRIQNAIDLAGGLSDGADRDSIGKNINLAEKVVDGQKIYIPKVSDTPQVVDSDSAHINQSGKISINTASRELLDSLPGIGEVRSQAIIDGRPYQKIEDLINRQVIPNYVYEDIKDKITL